MKIFLLSLATIFVIAGAYWIAHKISDRIDTLTFLLIIIIHAMSIYFMWGYWYFQPMGIEKISTYEPTPLDSVQEIILVDTDGNEFYFDILEVE